MLIAWFHKQDQSKLIATEKEAFESGFGRDFERDFLKKTLGSEFEISDTFRIRFVHKFLQSKSQAA